jgi:hypothetical protein
MGGELFGRGWEESCRGRNLDLGNGHTGTYSWKKALAVHLRSMCLTLTLKVMREGLAEWLKW